MGKKGSTNLSKGFVDKIALLLKKYNEYGLTLTELISISGLSHPVVLEIFDELEDLNRLLVKSDGLSRIYRVR